MRRIRGLISCIPVALIVALLGRGVRADTNEPLPIKVPVEAIVSPSEPSTPPAPSGMMARPEPPPATLPGERLPQYQSGFKKSDKLSQFPDGVIDFVLVSPAIIQQVGRPLRIRMDVQIDGAPFNDARQGTAENLIRASESSPSSGASGSGGESESDTAESETAISTADEEATETTDPTDAESDDEQDLDSNEAAGDTEPSVPSYQLTTDPLELARRYAQATGEPISENEASWLLNHWTQGPSLLLLQPFFQSFRGEERPAFRVLDRDRDGVISQQELASAKASFESCDADRNDIVDVLEIASEAKKLTNANRSREPAVPLLLLVADLQASTVGDATLMSYCKSLDQNENGRIDDDELESFLQPSPDLQFSVAFDTSEPKKSELILVSVSELVSVSKQSDIGGINLAVGPLAFNFAAIQGSASRQISLGAVLDGYPLLPMLDPNDDGRLTIRERRELTARLVNFDQDGDGRLTATEATAPLRVCVGLGPTAHRQLAGMRSLPKTELTEPVTGPDWFVRMDRNSDNDLSRSEFPGTDEQFADLDADSDDLVSAAEANQYEKQSNATQPKP